MILYISAISIIVVILIALGTKWELNRKYVVTWCFVMASLAWISLYLFNRYSDNIPALTKVFLVLFEAGITTLIVVSILFFRDPDRTSPSENGVILSPADGTIVYIKEIREGEFPFAIKGRQMIALKDFTGDELIPGRGIQIGIGMNLLNVHVNRSPIDGRIVQIRRIPGGFFSLKKVNSLLENERVLTVVDGEEIKLGIVQIASRLVRRIISYHEVGEEVAAGQRIGMIRFGSQVDLLLPLVENIRIMVKPGDEVKAGVSIITKFKSLGD